MHKADIFTKRDFDAVQEAKRTIHDLLPQLDKAENCGIECAEIRQVAEAFRTRLEAIEKNFMSPPPTR